MKKPRFHYCNKGISAVSESEFADKEKEGAHLIAETGRPLNGSESVQAIFCPA